MIMFKTENMDKCIYDRKKEESVEKWRMIQNLSGRATTGLQLHMRASTETNYCTSHLTENFCTASPPKLRTGCGPGHIARYLRDIGLAKVFGLDLSPAMVEQARKLNADLSFKVGNVMALDLVDASLGGIVAFYAIVNIPPNLLPTVFREMCRVLKPGGRLLLTFHIGDEIVQPTEFLGQPTSMQFFFFQPATITKQLEAAGFTVEDVVERGPYAPEVEYQSRRAYIFAAKAE